MGGAEIFMIHPEQLDDEVLLTNIQTSYYHHIGWATRRPGKIAYDKKGNPVEGMIPVFVKISEIRETIHICQKMLDQVSL
jgi:hypothetical protein